MPLLGDYLGQLLSELALARMRADLETVRIAELYASHPLLKTMAVPYIRVPEVNLDVPVLIRKAETPASPGAPQGGLDAERAREVFDGLLDASLKRAGVQVGDADRVKLKGAIATRLERGALPKEVSGDVRRLADEMTAATLEFLKAVPGRRAVAGEALQNLAQGLRVDARLALLKVRTAPPRLEVGVTSDEIKNLGTPENVTHLRLRIAEHGLEWVNVEGEDGVQERLVQE